MLANTYNPEILNTLLNSSSEGITLWDLEANLVYFNEKAKEITQFNLEIGKNLYNYKPKGLLIDEFGETLTRELYPLLVSIKTLKDHPPVRIGLKLDDRIQWSEISTRVIEMEGTKYVVSSFHEISKLVQTEQRFLDTFNYAPIGICLVSLEGKFINCNPALANMLGYTNEELVKLTFQEITHPLDLNLDLELFNQTLSGEINKYSLEKRYYHKTGHIVHAQLHVYLVRKPNGQPDYFISQIVDISPLQKTLSALNNKNIQLLNTSKNLQLKIAQLEEFSQIVAHNLRSVAANIKSTIEAIDSSQTQEERELFLNLLKEPSENLLDTLADVMHIIELRDNESLPKQECYFETIVDKVKTQLNLEIKESNSVLQTQFTVKSIVYAKPYLESILYNLISNSIKYRKEHLAPVIKVLTHKKGNNIVLEVEDNGIGINLSRHKNSLFKYRKPLTDRKESKGMGLFLIKNQIEAMGGSIQIESTELVGTKITVVL